VGAKQYPRHMLSRGVTGVYSGNIAQVLILVKPYSYTQSSLNALEKSFSKDRMQGYLQEMGNDSAKAFELYAWNTRMSAELFIPLQGVEISLRNALHNELSSVFGAYWFDNAAVPLVPYAKNQVAQVKKTLTSSNKAIKPSAVMDELSFGFWVSLLGRGQRNSYETQLWIPHLHKAFPNANVSRSSVHQPLDKLRKLRNRIAHHEPIFNRSIQNDYQTMLQMCQLIDIEMAQWVEHHNNVDAVLLTRPIP